MGELNVVGYGGAMERLSDERLLAAVLAGELEALTQLVERYQRPLTGYLERLLGGDWPLAQDLTQETFLRVLRQRDCRGQRPFKPWLYAIATNLARDHFKSATNRRVTPLDDVTAEGLVAGAADPEEQTLARERGHEIMAALATLSEEYRVTLLLRFYGDLSLREIADTLDIPVGTVKSRLSVGLRRLRAALLVADERDALDALYEREGGR
jgi:RNA polymerase sigma-70 factor (ECF subfamily)